MFCTNCGKDLPDGTQICPSCGEDLSQSTGGAAPSYVENSSQSTQGGFQPHEKLKDDRNLGMYILLSFVTCGIYSLYFLHKLSCDVNIACEGDGKKTPGLGALLLFSLLTCGFYGYYWYYALGNRLSDTAPRYNLSFQENGTTVLLWFLIGSLLCGIGPFIAMHILIKNTNQICAAYNRVNSL